ncbi:DUF4089 domain-containing protein [Trichormus azollae]|jgi:hypothetical protein|uniref:DUF4089 domain-containing protein n=1 Tax=Nostoc azollae (strain 0708) TaxID=551115 RepID=D7E0E5_NOSA0|nr:DUF4089 domain-containing protein [Trichormus azollae]ADI63054.1 conserved hypothetical protein ['Nostoc azollae' 0708]
MNNQEIDIDEYIEQISLLLNLEIKDEYRNEMIADFEKLISIAKIVNNCPLPEEIEIAPVFEP